MSEVAIRFEGVGKMYKVFSSRRDNLLDALGLMRFLPKRPDRFREFWALRGVDITLERGERLGIIGRNGAGKSTLLKMVTGNLPATEGSIEVHGDVQALLEIGGGLHPEFTGRENIEASLSFMGLNRTEIHTATAEIADFTELGRFLDQPFKTYSLGMQARLSIAIATTIEPDILIIDEILGAGDAYFFAKSTDRMKRLLEGGASVLLVSHALDQITRFCDRTIWLDRGRIVMQGDTIEVVKAYERFIRELDDRRIRAQNEKTRAGRFDAFERESYTDLLAARLHVNHSACCDVTRLALSRDDVVEEDVFVGAAQDADIGQAAHVLLEPTGWGVPQVEGDRFYRSVEAVDAAATASASFNLWFYYAASTYEILVEYRLAGGDARLEIFRGGERIGAVELRPAPEWTTARVALEAPVETGKQGESELSVSHWPSNGELMIDELKLLTEHDVETAVFVVGGALRIRFSIRAQRSGSFDVIPVILLFRTDGVLVTRHVSPRETMRMEAGDVAYATLDLQPLQLGNGRYLVTAGIYKQLDPNEIEPAVFYDVVDKSYEFQVSGNPPLHNELLSHPDSWGIEQAPRTPGEFVTQSASDTGR
jgi:lipopolysaccharide transport system ATP-binding protein